MSVQIARLDSRVPDFAQRLAAVRAFEPAQDESIEQTVAAIVRDVRVRGDDALLEYTRRFDRLEVAAADALELPRSEIQQALDALAPVDRDALQTAASRVRRYHEHQLAQSWSFVEADGTRLGQKVSALDRVGLYVPGGKAAYPSSVLMNALPARVAGVRELVMVVPTPDGVRNAMVLAAACIAGVDRVFTIGGAQAVAALAFGTKTVPAVDKIVGPGNAYVAEAKRRVFGTVGIDMIAGPSEILVLCDGTTDPDWVAMDLFAQAEHDELAQSILLSPDAEYVERVAASIEKLLPQMTRSETIARSLAGRGALVVVRSMDEACDIANDLAAEHVEISARDPEKWAARIRHAGALFLGPWSSEAIGDYCAGPNHVLPTMRTARFSSPLGVYDFQKRTSVIEVSRSGASTLGAVAATLARGEGLQAHALSASMRIEASAAHDVAAAAHGDAMQTLVGAAGTPDDAGSSGAEPKRIDPVRPEIVAMTGYRVLESSGLVKLDAMENPYRLPQSLRGELGRRLGNVPINRYPAPGHDRLKDAIRSAFAVPDGFDVVLGNGSDELISMIAVATARPGATHLAPQPSFVMYELSATLAGSRFVGIALRSDFSLDLPAMLDAIAEHSPAVVWLAYPNNPTGNRFDDAAIESVIRAAPGLVVVDEAYQPFALESWMPRLPAHPNLAVLRTVSKLGLAGLRLGYLVAAPRWTSQFEKVRPPYNVNVLTDEAACFALEHLEVLDAQAAKLRADRDRLSEALAQLPGVEVFESSANFVLVRVADSERTERALRERGLLIKDVGRMHDLLRNCLRLTVGTSEENRLLLQALRDSL